MESGTASNTNNRLNPKSLIRSRSHRKLIIWWTCAIPSEEISCNITGMATAAKNTAQGAVDSEKAARQLATTSRELRELVEQFKV
jgi:hypothetical protein